MAENSKPGPNRRVSDEEILARFRETPDPVLSTAEVADQLPLARRSVLKRLDALCDEGSLAKKKIGGRNTVWWLDDAQ